MSEGGRRGAALPGATREAQGGSQAVCGRPPQALCPARTPLPLDGEGLLQEGRTVAEASAFLCRQRFPGKLEGMTVQWGPSGWAD